MLQCSGAEDLRTRPYTEQALWSADVAVLQAVASYARQYKERVANIRHL